MSGLLRGVAWGAVGYLVGAVGGALLVQALSPNTHDLAIEAPTTGAFVTGPLVAIVAMVNGLARGARRSSPDAVSPAP